MNLALVSTQAGWGGGEALLATLAAGLRRRAARIAIATPAGSGAHKWAEAEGIECLALPGRGRSPTAMWQLRQWVRRRDFDGVVLNDPHAITYGGMALAGAGAPRVGVRHTVFPVRSGWKHNRLLERVVAVSEAARDVCLAGGVDAERLCVIHGGVEPQAIDPTSVEAARERFASASSDPNERRLLAVGSLLPVKGFDTLIRAVARASEQGQAWRLFIAGEGSLRDELQSLASELGVEHRVEWLGFVDPIAPLLSAADAFISASHSEGLSLVLVEAMLAGVPIAATPVGGAREVLNVSGGAEGVSPFADLFTPGDVETAYCAIDRALAERDTEYGRLDAARAWASERFTVDRMASDYVRLFEELLGGSAPASRHAA